MLVEHHLWPAWADRDGDYRHTLGAGRAALRWFQRGPRPGPGPLPGVFLHRQRQPVRGLLRSPGSGRPTGMTRAVPGVTLDECGESRRAVTSGGDRFRLRALRQGKRAEEADVVSKIVRRKLISANVNAKRADFAL